MSVSAFSYFFFSSRRRHTRCALVTGVQTCALPICFAWPAQMPPCPFPLFDPAARHLDRRVVVEVLDHLAARAHLFCENTVLTSAPHQRSEERRVGKECVSTCRSRWSPYH